jgi:hypothetical protein
LAKSDAGESDDLLLLLNDGAAPREVRWFAARGLLPLDRDGRIRALIAVLEDPDTEVSREATRTLETTPPDDLSRFVQGAAPTPREIDAIARVTEDSIVLERIIRHRDVSDETLEALAAKVTGVPQEALIVNHVRLLLRPALIDALFVNPGLTAEGRRLLNEIKEEFFEKEKRRREAERTLERQAALEQLREKLASEREEPEAREEEEEDEEETPAGDSASEASGEAYLRIMRLSVPERVKLALSGGKEERRLLIADASKLVAFSVLKGRGITVTEVESFCTMRHLDNEIFKKIAQTREWIRRAPVRLALVKNPRVPLTISLPLLKQLSLRELKGIARDRNLPSALRATARRLFFEKRQ